jgi:AcrR family transcriptional regulator
MCIWIQCCIVQAVSRLTREQRRSRTREELLDAASTLFARDGIQATSVEQIAAEAGYTRGAVYSNFADKDELVVALLDRRVRQSTAEVAALYERVPEPDAFYRALHERARRRSTAEHERVLFVEFWLHALRNPGVRPALAERLRAWRDAIARVVTRQFADLGVELPRPAEHMAAVVLAMDEGLALHRQVDPDAHPDGLLFDALSDMLQGQAALSRERQRQGQPPRRRG